jgi:Domain of unknown function (DUF4166)
MDTIKEITATAFSTDTASSRRPAPSSRRELVPAPGPRPFAPGRSWQPFAPTRSRHPLALAPAIPQPDPASRLPLPTPTSRAPQREPHNPSGIHGLLGDLAWQGLPPAVRARFGEPTPRVDYIGEFDIVRASLVGRVIAWLCQAIGTPVVPRTGVRVPAIIHVGPVDRGASWRREYQWPRGRACQVNSTKVISPNGTLIEELPAGLRMPLSVYQHRGVLHFVSTRYYFEFQLGPRLGPRPGHSHGQRGLFGSLLHARTIKIPLPAWLSPGTTHVEHADESKGWFRFTMTVTHPLFGEVFYQTGRFRAAENPS